MYRGNITQMWWLSTLLALLLPCPAYNTQCSNDVPADCEFSNTDDGFCGWKHQNWKHDHSCRNSSQDWYAYLTNKTLSGCMKSKERCVSSHISHCLRFRFRLGWNKNRTYSLNVSISWPANNTPSLLWTYSNQTVWTNASVPVRSAANFTLIISARSLNATHNKDIRVDKLKYTNSSCDIIPSSAKPPATDPPTMNSTTSPPPPPPATTTTTTTKITTTTTTTTTRTTKTTSSTPTPKTMTSSSTTTPSSKTGIIVGIVLAVIGAVVFGVVVCIVIRRRQISLLATFSARKNNHPDDSGYHNAAFDSVGENYNEVNATANCPDSSAARICSGMSNGDYSVIDDIQTNDVTSSEFQPMTSLYSRANVFHSVHREDSKPQTSSPDANPYDLIDEELGVCQARGSSLTVEYNILASHKTAENLPQPTQTGGVYHVLRQDTQVTESGPTGVYHILEETETRNATEKEMSSHPDTCLSEGAKGDYHSLDFQKGRGGDVTGDSGDEMGQTYSHLNEAGEDTYSELSREKKRKVVDGDYSHVTMD